MKWTRICDEMGILVGGRGGWIINHTFSIEGSGYGLVNSISRSGDLLLENPELYLGYGGLEMEYVHHSKKLSHWTVQLLIGAGGVGYYEPEDMTEDRSLESDAFFILEPGVQCELNVAPFFRMEAGLSYRFVSGIRKYGLTNTDIGGPGIGLTFKFGRF